MSVTPQQTPELPFTFGDGFLEDHAGHIITDPRIALIELIANAYDAGATKVEIQWPDSVGQVVTIRDNGSGMTRPEFEHRWKTLCYKRPQEQGAFADNPNKISGKPRPAFGKSGKGRHIWTNGNPFTSRPAPPKMCAGCSVGPQKVMESKGEFLLPN